MDETKRETIRQPRYQQVAVSIAERIVEGRYDVGEKIHARSTLATHFNVSPETARKAINILVDLDIMEVKHGSGAFVCSKEKAEEYVDQFKNVMSIQSIYDEMKNSLLVQKKERENTEQLLNRLVSQTKRVHNQLPFVPYEIELTEKAHYLDKNINELNFWHQTGATIIAIQTDHELMLSPGPYAKLMPRTKLYFVGSEEVFQRVESFFYE